MCSADVLWMATVSSAVATRATRSKSSQCICWRARFARRGDPRASGKKPRRLYWDLDPSRPWRPPPFFPPMSAHSRVSCLWEARGAEGEGRGGVVTEPLAAMLTAFGHLLGATSVFPGVVCNGRWETVLVCAQGDMKVGSRELIEA